MTYTKKVWGLFMAFAMTACVLFACTGPTPAHADTRVGAHVGSHHFTGEWNNVNPGVYVYHNGWTAGAYRNSERSNSAYAGYTWEYPLTSRIDAAVTVGAITGYKRAAVLPLVLPSITYKLTPVHSVRVGFVPPAGKGSSAAVHLMFEQRF